MGGSGRRHPGAFRWSTQAGFAVAVVHRRVVGQGVPCWHRISSRHPLRAVKTSLSVHNPEGTLMLAAFFCACLFDGCLM